MKRLYGLALALCTLAPLADAAEPLRANHFAEAIPLTTEVNRPVQQLAVPDVVYQRVVSPVLNDLAVFNAAGSPVAHVLCTVSSQQSVSHTLSWLTVFPVQMTRRDGQGATAELRRTDGGDTIAITVPGSESGSTVAVSAYDLDLSALPDEAVALTVKWHSPTGLSEVDLRVDRDDAAQRWRAVASAVLKRLTADGQTLETSDILLPAAHYKTLRLTPNEPDGVVIDRVQVLTRHVTAKPADVYWFTAAPTGPAADADAVNVSTASYDAQRQAPVTTARIQLTTPNSRHDLQLQSRSTPEARWQTVWAGEAFYLLTPGGERRNDDLVLAPNRDRYWRLLTEGANASFAPKLDLAYTPQTLRFVAEGQGPYRLVYGNASATQQAPETSCEGLLTTLLKSSGDGSTEAQASLIGTAEAGAVQVLAGAAALKVLAPQAKDLWRRWLLWGVLGLAVVLLLGMARKLLADLKQSNSQDP